MPVGSSPLESPTPEKGGPRQVRSSRAVSTDCGEGVDESVTVTVMLFLDWSRSRYACPHQASSFKPSSSILASRGLSVISCLCETGRDHPQAHPLRSPLLSQICPGERAVLIRHYGCDMYDEHYRDWVSQALCAGMPSAIFFDYGYSAPAVRICRACPVSRECLDYALDLERQNIRGGRHGIFGGKTPEERKKLARKRRTLDACH